MNKDIVVIGDIMLDRYVEGISERMSPEAPVPILLAKEESYRIGGAANVANNLQNLGVSVHIIGSVAEDRFGNILDKMIKESGIGNLILKDHSITCVKTRIIAKSQHLLRIDREAQYIFNEAMLSHIKDSISKISPAYIIISDYNKGMITEELMSMIKDNFAQIKVLVDPKGLKWQKYSGPYLIKPNLSEIHSVVEVINPLNDEGIAKIQAYRVSLACDNLLITLSAKGMMLLNDAGHQLFGVDPAEVYDVTGAGDTAIAALVYGLSLGKSLDDAIILANQASRYVVTKPKTYAIQRKDLEI